MNRLWVMTGVVAALAIALAAQRASGDAGSVIEAPPITFGALEHRGWSELPKVAHAAEQAVAAAKIGGATSVRVWGDPALGCFAAGVAVRVPGRDGQPAELAEALATAFGGELGDSAIHAGAGGVRGEHRAAYGSLRGWLLFRTRSSPAVEHLEAEAAACFHNQRAPARCSALCAEARKRFEGKS